jgi:hypothetical protein
MAKSRIGFVSLPKKWNLVWPYIGDMSLVLRVGSGEVQCMIKRCVSLV